MIGTVFVQFQNYVNDNFGKGVWGSILTNAGFSSDKVFHTVHFYPDEDLDRLLLSAAVKTGLRREVLVRKIGYYCGCYLVKMYKMLFFANWRTIDVIEKAAPKVYKSMQFIDIYAAKSTISCERISDNEVIVKYQSPRKLCGYVIGIFDAIAEYFEERVEVTHVECMCSGARECKMLVKLVKAGIPSLKG